MPANEDHSIYSEEYFDDIRTEKMTLSETEKLIKKETVPGAGETGLVTSWRRFLIGPVLFTYMAGYIMSYYIITEYTNSYQLKQFFHDANLTYQKTSDSVCNASSDSLEYQTETRATESAANWIVYYSLAQGIPAIISSTVLGSYTDALGRRFLLSVGILGTTVRMCISVVIIRYDLGLIYFIIACIVEGCTGQFSTVLQTCLAYMADITKPGEQRVYGIIYIEFFLGFSLTSASFVTGILIRNFGYFVPVSVAAGLLLLSLLIVLILLPESFPASRRHRDKSLCTIIQNSFSFFVHNDSQNNRWKYQIIAVGHFLTGISFLGRISTETLYQLSSPFCWTADRVGYYGAIRTGIQVTLGLGSIKMFRMCGLSDPLIAMVGVLSYGANFAIEALSTSNVMLYIGQFFSKAKIISRHIILKPTIAAMHDPHSVFDIGHCAVIQCDAGGVWRVVQ